MFIIIFSQYESSSQLARREIFKGTRGIIKAFKVKLSGGEGGVTKETGTSVNTPNRIIFFFF